MSSVRPSLPSATMVLLSSLSLQPHGSTPVGAQVGHLSVRLNVWAVSVVLRYLGAHTHSQ